MRITATAVKAKDLKPGDLFNRFCPQSYWDNLKQASLGEKVYIRTNTPVPDEEQGEVEVYRITIEQEKQ